jgi:hypothetical protein
VNETADSQLLGLIVPHRIDFAGDALTSLTERGLYANTRALRKAKGK